MALTEDQKIIRQIRSQEEKTKLEKRPLAAGREQTKKIKQAFLKKSICTHVGTIFENRIFSKFEENRECYYTAECYRGGMFLSDGTISEVQSAGEITVRRKGLLDYE